MEENGNVDANYSSKKTELNKETKIDFQKSKNEIAPKEVEQKEKSLWKRFLSFIDIDLLKDPKFVNLMIGMSIAICAEMNFSLLTPFILSEYGFSTVETAQVLAVLAFVDITFRLLAPLVQKWLKKSAKMMYCITLIMLITTRTSKNISYCYISKSQNRL